MTLQILAAVPTHSGAVESVTAETLLQLQAALAARGDRLATRFPSGSDISALRNLIVADFLSSGADVLLMLDSDQGLSAATLMRMLDRGQPVVGCFYPRRAYNWSTVRPGESSADLPRILYQASQFVGALATGPEEAVALDDGFARAEYVGAGALLVRRSAFEQLGRRYPELRGRGFDSREFPPPRFAENWGFFNRMADDDAPLSEDYAFCRRWREAGGEIWADLTATSAHVGRWMFSGNYLDYLKAHAPRG